MEYFVTDPSRPMTSFGIVIIGRNEGERLRRALESVRKPGVAIVYVDSHSTDRSVELAQSMGADVLQLDRSVPFTAALARNRGFERLLQIAPGIDAVQFVDGDCELVAGWLERAHAVLNEHSEIAVVCGRLRERFPDRSVYNRLADLEWDSPVGEIEGCGGIAMIRVTAFQAVRGFDPSMIAGEEGELCLRLRQRGWTIVRRDAEMALHDMDMTRFAQWWKRSVRTGHAYAEGSALHGRTSERHCVRQTRSALFWGISVPLGALALAWPTRGWSLLLLGGYLFLYHRTCLYYADRRGWPVPDARLYSAWIVLAKFPQAVGLVRYWFGRLSGKRSTVIEHRGAVPSGGSAVG